MMLVNNTKYSWISDDARCCKLAFTGEAAASIRLREKVKYCVPAIPMMQTGP